jgi:hypothetical protein
MTGGMQIDRYKWPGGQEALLRFGETPRVVLTLPLFEEYNRTRAFGVTLLHDLAARGIGGLLPDWPGTGESLIPTKAATLGAMRAAFAAIIDGYDGLFALSIRSGALIDADTSVRACWRFAPQTGADLIRELDRQTSVEGDVAGNFVSIALREEIAAAPQGRGRVVRLETDPRDADLKIAGTPLWRRAEPDNDAALVARLADDIAEWIDRCGG